MSVRVLALRDPVFDHIHRTLRLPGDGKRLWAALTHLQLHTFETTRRCTLAFVSALMHAHPDLESLRCERVTDAGDTWEYKNKCGAKEDKIKFATKLHSFRVAFGTGRLFECLNMSRLRALCIQFMPSSFTKHIVLPSLRTLVVTGFEEDMSGLMSHIEAPRLSHVRVKNRLESNALDTLEWMSAFPLLETCVLHDLCPLANTRLPTPPLLCLVTFRVQIAFPIQMRHDNPRHNNYLDVRDLLVTFPNLTRYSIHQGNKISGSISTLVVATSTMPAHMLTRVSRLRTDTREMVRRMLFSFTSHSPVTGINDKDINLDHE
jgi:hypothetical protein